MGLGGCLGSVLRYLLSLVPLDRTGSFPVNTLLTNVLGAFAIGLLAAYGVVPQDSIKTSFFAAELSLEGECRAVHGILPMVIAARFLSRAPTA